MLTQEQYNILQRKTRHLNIKVEILNQFDAIIDSFEGIATSGDINLSSDSTYRRTGNVSIAMKDETLLPRSKSKIWFNRKARILIGLKDWNDSVIWFNQGIFIIQSADVTNNISESTIDFELNDLMSNIDGTLNGNTSHETEIIPEGITVSEALRSTLSQLGKISIDDLRINDVDLEVPYTLSFQPNDTVYEIAKQLLDLYMGMEMFYDENGILIVQKIRDRKSDPILWDFSKNGMDLAVDYQNQFNFSNIRNAIYLWGRKKDTGETVKWVYRNKYSRRTITERNAISDMELGDICHVENENISYVWNDSWIALTFTVPKEFNIENIGLKQFSYTEEKIATIEQAQLKAEYELTKRGNFAETVSFSSVPIYNLNPNSKIYLDDKKSGVKGEYIVTSVSVPLSIDGTMSISATKLYY